MVERRERVLLRFASSHGLLPGVRDLSGFVISGLAELLNELAKELGHADIPKAVEAERACLLLDALRGTKRLLILDNLGSLLKRC